jgi:hypothetical protein
MRAGPAALALLLVSPAPATAEWQIKPFVGVTFAGSTTFITEEVEDAAGSPNLAVGVSGMLLGNVVGVEADFGHAPGFFSGDRTLLGAAEPLVERSWVTTLTGNVVGTLPRRLTQYTLRPYVVGGAGLMHVHIEDQLGVFVPRTLAALDVGGGVTGFLTPRIGLSWDVRYFHSIGGRTDTGLSIGEEQLSFWRANMALAIRID